MRNILKAFFSAQWAVLPDRLQMMQAIVEGDAAQIQALMPKDGRPLQQTRTVEMHGAVAVVPAAGPMFRYSNLMTEHCGATSTELFIKDLTTAAHSPSTKALVIQFDTPGGEVRGISDAAEYINKLQAETGKPILAFVDGMAASAGYWLASQCAEIVLSKTAQVGSIGVVSGYRVAKDSPEVMEMVSARTPGKRPDFSTEEGRDKLQQTLDDAAAVFIAEAAAGRNMTEQALLDACDQGWIVTGQKAVDKGLADRTGTLMELVEQLNAGYQSKKRKRSAQNQSANQSAKQTTNQPKGAAKMAYTTLAELRADNPELVAEAEAAAEAKAKAALADDVAAARAEGEQTGAEVERQRVNTICAANVLGYENLRIEALKNGDDANALNAAVLAAEASARADKKAGAKDADTNALAAGDESHEPKPVKRTAAQLKQVASDYVKEQAAAGKTIDYATAVRMAANGEI